MDPIKQLEAISEELDTHAVRLGERANQIKTLAANEPDPARRELLELHAEAFSEMVNTGLDFQRELIGRLADAVESIAAPPDVGLEPEDADRFIKVFQEYQALLEAGLQNLAKDTPAAMRSEWEQKLAECKAVIERVEELTFDDGEPGDEEDEDDTEEESAPN